MSVNHILPPPIYRDLSFVYHCLLHIGLGSTTAMTITQAALIAKGYPLETINATKAEFLAELANPPKIRKWSQS